MYSSTPDFRAQYLKGAIECLGLLGKQDLNHQETWANLLGAIANGVIASVPDTVAYAYLSSEAERIKMQRDFREALRDKLKGV